MAAAHVVGDAAPGQCLASYDAEVEDPPTEPLGVPEVGNAQGHVFGSACRTPPVADLWLLSLRGLPSSRSEWGLGPGRSASAAGWDVQMRRSALVNSSACSSVGGPSARKDAFPSRSTSIVVTWSAVVIAQLRR
jgi:hypothetical protein